MFKVFIYLYIFWIMFFVRHGYEYSRITQKQPVALIGVARYIHGVLVGSMSVLQHPLDHFLYGEGRDSNVSHSFNTCRHSSIRVNWNKLLTAVAFL